jgi:hypothetical protein
MNAVLKMNPKGDDLRLCVYTEGTRDRAAEKDNEPKRDEITGEWRRLHNKERHDPYWAPCIIRVIKSRRMMGGACSM